jgi:CBS domain-containing protein
MWEHDCGFIPVVRDDGELAGVITDRDICMAAFTQGRLLEDILVNTAMARHVITAAPDLKLTDVERLMAEHRVRRLPVIDSDGKPIGVISMNDLAIEAVRPRTKMKHGPLEIGHTLAAISTHRTSHDAAA